MLGLVIAFSFNFSFNAARVNPSNAAFDSTLHDQSFSEPMEGFVSRNRASVRRVSGECQEEQSLLIWLMPVGRVEPGEPGRLVCMF
ncbi:hypothetical protein D6T65_15445 [Arthrobacter frigidicola]|nr:hypothetical protein D6T65_15445 [Arthrobacter frigidicola]